MAEGDFITQVVQIAPGQCVILPSDAVVQGITEFGGGVASSPCVLPTPEGTVTYYFVVEQNPSEEGDQVYCLVDLIIGNYTSEFPDGCNRIAITDITNPPSFINHDFINTVKSNPLVLELRGATPGNTIKWSLTVPASAPIPYFNCYLTNDSGPWFLRQYPITPEDGHYAATVADLSDPDTIL
jgi:hypothetical protein